jgi:hypothetical protein
MKPVIKFITAMLVILSLTVAASPLDSKADYECVADSRGRSKRSIPVQLVGPDSPYVYTVFLGVPVSARYDIILDKLTIQLGDNESSFTLAGESFISVNSSKYRIQCYR